VLTGALPVGVLVELPSEPEVVPPDAFVPPDAVVVDPDDAAAVPEVPESEEPPQALNRIASATADAVARRLEVSIRQP